MDTYLSSLVGKRSWFLRSAGLNFYLVSINIPYIWPYYAPFKAFHGSYCVKHFRDPDVEFSKCEGCGIYAYKLDCININEIKGGLFGKVNLWGKCIEHELGYRVEYAYPSEILKTCCVTCQQYSLPSVSIFTKCEKYYSITTYPLQRNPLDTILYRIFCSHECVFRWFGDELISNVEIIDTYEILNSLESSYGVIVR